MNLLWWIASWLGYGGASTSAAYVDDFVCVDSPDRWVVVDSPARYADVSGTSWIVVPSPVRYALVGAPDRWIDVPRRRNGCS